MKMKLPKLLLAFVIASMSCSSLYAEVKPDNIDYTLSDNGDGTYAATATIGDGVNVNMAGGLYVKYVDEVVYQTKVKDVNITMTGGTISYILAAGNFRALPVMGDVNIEVTGGYVDKLVGANHLSTDLTPGYNVDYRDGQKIDSINITVGGNAEINTLLGGSSCSPDDGWPTSEFVDKYSTMGDVTINVEDNAQVKTLRGVGYDYSKVDGSVTVNVDGGTIDKLYAVGSSTVTEDVTVNLRGGKVTGDILVGSGSIGGTTILNIGSEEKAYIGSVGSISGFDQINVAKGSSVTTTSGNILDTAIHNYTVTSDNLNAAIVTTAGDVAVNAPVTFILSSDEKLASGRYMIIDASEGTVDTTNWNADNVSVEGLGGDFSSLTWEGNVLTFIYRGEEIDSAIASNWGTFKSSQAFVKTLWGDRANAVEIKTTDDGKGGMIPGNRTVAWGTVYGQSARISGIGADYSLYGGSIGAEHQFVNGRSIGAAIGYDWGTVSPFGAQDIDQETAHFALYGRAYTWQINQASSIVVDWSAAIGESTSETDSIPDDWEQESIQLDARVSYLRQLNTATVGSFFVGLQYYAADSASVSGIEISSLQNLRTSVGTGLSYKASEKTTLYGEISLYNDAMRHNPHVTSGGARFSGTNPGRMGGSISAGASYQLNNDWKLRANYNFDAADDSTEHNVNVGAAYSF